MVAGLRISDIPVYHPFKEMYDHNLWVAIVGKRVYCGPYTFFDSSSIAFDGSHMLISSTDMKCYWIKMFMELVLVKLWITMIVCDGETFGCILIHYFIETLGDGA